jgi:hypothetical protein
VDDAHLLADADREQSLRVASQFAVRRLASAMDQHARNIWDVYNRQAPNLLNDNLQLEWELRVLRYLCNRSVEDFEHQTKGSDAGLKVSYVEERWGHFERYRDALGLPRFVPILGRLSTAHTPAMVVMEYDEWLDLAKLCQVSQADRRGPSLDTMPFAIGHAPTKVDQAYILKVISALQVGKGRDEEIDLKSLEGDYTQEFLDQFRTPTQQFAFCFAGPNPASDLSSAGVGWLAKNGYIEDAVAKLKKLSAKDLQLLRKFTSGYIVAMNGFVKPKLMRCEFDEKQMDTALGKGCSNNPQGDGLQALLRQHLGLLVRLQDGWRWLLERALLPFPASELQESMELAYAGQYDTATALQAASLLYRWDPREVLRIGSCDGAPSGDWAATKVGASLTRGEREADGFRLTCVVFILDRVLPFSVTWDNCLDFANLAQQLHRAHDPGEPGISATERAWRLAAIEQMPAELEMQAALDKRSLRSGDVTRNRDKFFNQARYDYWYRAAQQCEWEQFLLKAGMAYGQCDVPPVLSAIGDLAGHLPQEERVAQDGLLRFKAKVAKSVGTLLVFMQKLAHGTLDEEKDVALAIEKLELLNGGDLVDVMVSWMMTRQPTDAELAGVMRPMEPYLSEVVTFVAQEAGPGLWGQSMRRLFAGASGTQTFDEIDESNLLRMGDLAELMLWVQGGLSGRSVGRGILDLLSDLVQLRLPSALGGR